MDWTSAMTQLNPNKEVCKSKTFVKKISQKTCSKERLPILKWLPLYKKEYFIQDVIAGITVGLTAIPQGIAYAVIAGLPPEYGLYASLTSGIIYVFFGSCYNVTVGPTAILAAMTAKYVSNYSTDFAILAAFLSGMLIFIMGVLQLGFLVDFISMPVISGFTTAAALQIAASQFKSFFGLSGSSGDNFAESVYNFFKNIKTAKLWDPILASATIVTLLLLQSLGNNCKRTDGLIKKLRWFISLSRNAVVVIIGMIITYVLKVTIDCEPLAIIGNIGSGLPKFDWPPFSTVVGNETIYFEDMMKVLGPQAIVIPFVSILETVAIAKAFADGATVDATQEMIAVGLCNIIGSFGQSMPITGSFTRTALNHVSGVKTPAGGVTKVLLLIIALTLFTSTFYYIPKASLAGLILVAMFSMMDFAIFVKLWKNSKGELFILIITTLVCLAFGLEYGIISGILIEALSALYMLARPSLDVKYAKSENNDVLSITLTESVLYCAAEHIRKTVLKESLHSDAVIIIDGTNLKQIDYTVASNLMLVTSDLEKKAKNIFFKNFNVNLRSFCIDINPQYESKFIYGSSNIDNDMLVNKNV